MSVSKSFIHSPVFIVFCFLVVLMSALGFSRFSQSNDDPYSEKIEPLLVETMGSDLEKHFSGGERYVGRVEAGQRAEVGFDISGVITSVLKSEGDHFKKGDSLATLDTQRLLAKQRELEASMTRATAAKKLAKISLQRAQSLKATRSISDQALDEAQQKKDSADAEYDLVVAQLASVDVELKKATLFAPFDGVVIDRLTDAGRATNPGSPVLLLEETSKTEIRVGMPLKEARQLKVGDELTIIRGSESFIGKVDRINLALSASRVSEVYLLPDLSSVISTKETVNKMDNPKRESILISGELVHVLIEKSAQTHQGIWLPLSALSEYGRGLWSVYIAKPEVSSPFAKVERTIVEVIQIQGEYAQIKGGVTQDTQSYVIRTSPHRVVDGQIVRLATAKVSEGKSND